MSAGHPRSKSYYKRKAKENWWLWRLVFPPGDIKSSITYREASEMEQEEIMEANAALELRIEEAKKNRTKKKKRGGRK